MKYLWWTVVAILVVAGAAYYFFTHTAIAPGPGVATSTPAALLAADAYPLYPALQWGAVRSATMENLSGYAVESAPVAGIANIAAVSAPFEQYWRGKLQGEGYSVDNSLAAGGPGADVVAYKKGSDYIIVSFRTVFKGTPQNAPVQCPCDTTFSVFTTASSTASYKDATYTIEGKTVTLVNGTASEPAVLDSTGSPQAGSASMITTQYFGNEAMGDLNGDGMPDAAFLLTQSGGGSGTFYYVVVALKTAAGYTGTNAVLLGDRVAPQTTEIHGGQLVVNYADRKPGEPMTAQPSVGVSKYLKISGSQLVETGK